MIDFDYAEIATAGSILVDSQCLPEIREILPGSEVFHSQPCGEVYAAACALADAGKPVDPVTVQKQCGVSKEFLLEAMSATPTAAHAGNHARIVLEGYQHRKLEEIAADLVAAESPGEGITTALAALEALADNERSRSSPGDDLAALLQYRAEMEDGRRKVLQVGFPSLDGILGGLRPGGLYIVGARTSVGKSAFSLAVADMLAKNHRVQYISLEMDRAEIAARRVAAFSSGISSYSALLNARSLPENASADLAATAARLSERQLTVEEAQFLTVGMAGVKARSAKAEILVLDYVGLMRGPGESEYDRITKISGDLKHLAQTLHIVVIALAQINREAEQGQDPRPKLSQLRSSGALEQDADGVLLLHRPDKGKGEALVSEPFEVIVAKNRHSGTGAATLTFYPATNRFEDSGTVKGRPYTVRSWAW